MKNKTELIVVLIILKSCISLVFCAAPANSGKILYRLANPVGPTSGYTATNGW